MLLFVALIIGISAYAQSDIESVQEFIDRHDKIHKYFVYQSTLRMLNQEKDPDFDRLIKPLKKVNAYVSKGDSGVTREEFKALLDQLESDDFEILLSYKEKNAIIQLHSKTSRSNSKYVFAVYGPDEYAIIEMDGSLDLQYLKALENIDFSKAEELLLTQKRS